MSANSDIILALDRIAQESNGISVKADELARKSFRISKLTKFSVILFSMLGGLISLRNASEPDTSYSYSSMVFCFLATAIKVIESIYAIERKGALMASISTRMRHINRDVASFKISADKTPEAQLIHVINMFNRDIESNRSLIYHTDIIGQDSTTIITEDQRRSLREDGIVVISEAPKVKKEEKKEERKEEKKEEPKKTVEQLEAELAALKTKPVESAPASV